MANSRITSACVLEIGQTRLSRNSWSAWETSKKESRVSQKARSREFWERNRSDFCPSFPSPRNCNASWTWSKVAPAVLNEFTLTKVSYRTENEPQTANTAKMRWEYCRDGSESREIDWRFSTDDPQGSRGSD